MKKLQFTCLCVCMIGGFVFANGNQDVQATGNGEKAKVVMWTSHTLTDYEAMEKIIGQYNDQSEVAEVELVKVVGSETDTTKLMTAVVGGVGPDIYFLDRFTVAQRASEGMLEDLTEYVDAEGDLPLQFVDYAWNEVQFDGKTYGLPFDTDARVIYYNKRMISEAGFDPAEFDPENGPMNIERFKEICMAINMKDETGAYTEIGFNPFVEQAWHYTWGFAFGGKFYDEKSNKVIIGEDEGVLNGFQFLYDWAKDMGPQDLATWKSTYFPPDLPPANHAFIQEKTAALVSGDWFLKTLADYGQDLDWGMTYIPTPDGSISSWSGGWSLVVPVGSKVVAESYDVLRYFAGEDGQKIFVTDTNHLPTWNGVMKQDELFTEDHKFFKSILPYSNSRPAVPVGALLWDQLTTVQDKMALNEEEPATALDEAQAQVNNRLNQIR